MEDSIDSIASGEPLPEENNRGLSKCVKTVMDMAIWQKSQAYYDLIGFINGISTAIQGKKLNDPMYISQTMQNLLTMMKKFDKLLDQTPPLDLPQRFGNQAYRTWFMKMEANARDYLVEVLTEGNCTYINELCVYLKESFGNPTRIDYGTGHELAFIMFLCCLFKTKYLVEEDNVACALKLFNSYLVFVRRLQKTYRMEPAGSQGVWSLDDYQFVPFIWGSAQLSSCSPFDPTKFLDKNIINDYKNSYMFISCIDYISHVKTGHFAEHSNQLWSISAVPSWIKINSGLVKMYQKEILSKFPVIQHVYFGTLMVFEPVKPGTPLPNARLGYMPPPAAPSVNPPTETKETQTEVTETKAEEVTETKVEEVTETKAEEITETKVEEVTETEVEKVTEVGKVTETETEVVEVTEAEVVDVTEAEVGEETEIEVDEVTETKVPEVTETDLPEVTET